MPGLTMGSWIVGCDYAGNRKYGVCFPRRERRPEPRFDARFQAKTRRKRVLESSRRLVPVACYRQFWLLCRQIRVTILPSRKSIAYQMTNGVLFMSVRFTQSCPTCGRRIQVRASLMGCDVRCQHCDAVFVAHEDSMYSPVQSRVTEDLNDPLMHRVEQALSRAEESAVVN